MHLNNNDLPGISPCVLWGAGKVVVGKYYLTVHIRKRRGKMLVLELEQKI